MLFRRIKQRNSNKAKNIEMVIARVWLKFPKITSARSWFQSSRHHAANIKLVIVGFSFYRIFFNKNT